MFQLDPSLPFAAFVNPKIAFSQSKDIVYLYNQIVDSYPSDQLAGQMTPGCKNLPYNQTSETQSLILAWYEAQTMAGAGQGQLPADIEQVLVANAGPVEMWNYSYEQWGVVHGVQGLVKTLYTAEVGTGNAVNVIMP